MYTLPNDGYMGKFPEIDAEAFVAPGAVVLGDVKIAKYASLWPGAVVRGDVSYIRIGEASNVQDVACLHVADEGPCIIGDYVTIGHGAIVHACTVGDNVLIGMNATVLTGAKIGSVFSDGTTGVENIILEDNDGTTHIFDLRGMDRGTDFDSLPTGVYIRGGKKVVKR